MKRKQKEIDRVMELYFKYRHSREIEITLKRNPDKKLVGQIKKVRFMHIHTDPNIVAGNSVPHTFYFYVSNPRHPKFEKIVEVDPYGIKEVRERKDFS